jgi:hypothetical protein
MKTPGPENRLFWDNEARLRAVGKGMNSPFEMKNTCKWRQDETLAKKV